MIVCGKCNTKNVSGSQYCDECGAPLPGAHVPTRPLGSFVMPAAEEMNGQMSMNEAPASMTRPEESAHSGSSNSRESTEVNGAHAKLVIERGRSTGKQFPLNDDESQIGRWDADGGIFPDVDLDADDPEAKVSRRHARIMRRNGQYFIEDLGSTNGTFINRGRRLLPGDRQLLRDGDEIIVGKTFLRFHIVK